MTFIPAFALTLTCWVTLIQLTITRLLVLKKLKAKIKLKLGHCPWQSCLYIRTFISCLTLFLKRKFKTRHRAFHLPYFYDDAIITSQCKFSYVSASIALLSAIFSFTKISQVLKSVEFFSKCHVRHFSICYRINLTE